MSSYLLLLLSREIKIADWKALRETVIFMHFSSLPIIPFFIAKFLIEYIRTEKTE